MRSGQITAAKLRCSVNGCSKFFVELGKFFNVSVILNNFLILVQQFQKLLCHYSITSRTNCLFIPRLTAYLNSCESSIFKGAILSHIAGSHSRPTHRREPFSSRLGN